MGGKDCVLLDFLKDEIKDNIYFFKKNSQSDWKFTLISVTKHSRLFSNCKNVISFQILENLLGYKDFEKSGKKI